METVGKKQFIIHSTDSNLLDTGISLKEGDLLKVDVVDPKQTESSDVASPKLQVNANGISVDTKEVNDICQREGASPDFKFPFSSLIGTLDGGKTYFPVGTHLEMTILTPVSNTLSSKTLCSNTLSFAFWGANPNINVGSLTVNIEVQKAYNHDAEIDNDKWFLDAENFLIHADRNNINTYDAQDISSLITEPLNTGIELEPGNLLIVNVDPIDCWNLAWDHRYWDMNANGVNAQGARYGQGLEKGYFKFTYGSLIGTLDEGKTYFPVGTHLEMTILSKGMLSFVIWDSDFANNIGAVRAFVKVDRNGITMRNNNHNLALKTNSQTKPENALLTAITYK